MGKERDRVLFDPARGNMEVVESKDLEELTAPLCCSPLAVAGLGEEEVGA